jgi:hypothetical protein
MCGMNNIKVYKTTQTRPNIYQQRKSAHNKTITANVTSKEYTTTSKAQIHRKHNGFTWF